MITSGRLPIFAELQDPTLCIAAGDVNGDGALDLFLGEAGRRQRLLINDGSGRFSDQSDDDGTGTARLPSNAMRGYKCKMFDIEEDGDLDVVVVNDVNTSTSPPSTQAPHIFLNDGTGHFTVTALTSPSGGPFDGRDVAYGDVNGDQLPDLVIVNDNFTVTHGGNAFEVHLGQCDGSFQLGGGLPASDKGLLGVALDDIRRLSACIGGASHRLWARRPQSHCWSVQPRAHRVCLCRGTSACVTRGNTRSRKREHAADACA